MARQRQLSHLRDTSPLRSWSFFENVGSNEVIWCTVFHHVKQLTACLLRYFFTLEQDGEKSGGARPPQSEKWRGHLPPGPPPPRFRRLWLYFYERNKTCNKYKKHKQKKFEHKTAFPAKQPKYRYNFVAFTWRIVKRCIVGEPKNPLCWHRHWKNIYPTTLK